ncbi:hypothetical protein [Streptomyces sp. NPDC003327]
MFEYELHRMHHAELVREAAAHRLSREATATGGRTGLLGRRHGDQGTEGRVSDGDQRTRFARAA